MTNVKVRLRVSDLPASSMRLSHQMQAWTYSMIQGTTYVNPFNDYGSHNIQALWQMQGSPFRSLLSVGLFRSLHEAPDYTLSLWA